MSRPPDARARDALADLRARLDDAARGTGASLAAYWRATRAACDDARRFGVEAFARGRARVDDEAAAALGGDEDAMATHATLMATLERAVRASAARARDEDEDARRRARERERERDDETTTRETTRRATSDDGATRRAIGSGFATVTTKKRSRRAGRGGRGERDADGARRAAGRIESESRRRGRRARGDAIAREISGGESRDGARDAGARGRGESFGGGGEGARGGTSRDERRRVSSARARWTARGGRRRGGVDRFRNRTSRR